MRVPLSIAVLLASVAMARAAPPPPEAPTIEVTGTCAAARTPDRARFSAAATRDAADAARAARSAIEAANTFRADIEKLHLPDAVIEASGVETARDPAEENDKRAAVRFSASASIGVETSSFDGLANAMRLAAQDGMDSIGPMETFLAPATRDAMVIACLPKAGADARRRAEAVLQGLGGTLGPVQQVTNIGSDGIEPFRPAPGLMRMAAAAPMPAPSAAAGPQTVTVSVTVKFGLAPPK